MRHIVGDIKSPAIWTGSAQLELTDALVSLDVDEHDYSIERSVINGHADIISRDEYLRGNIDYYAVSHANYLVLKDLQGTEKRLWPLGTGAIAGVSPTRYYPYVDVIITRVYPYHRNNAMYYDACIIEFESVDPYTLARAADTGISPT
jgi:hypothetical protein